MLSNKLAAVLIIIYVVPDVKGTPVGLANGMQSQYNGNELKGDWCSLPVTGPSFFKP